MLNKSVNGIQYNWKMVLELFEIFIIANTRVDTTTYSKARQPAVRSAPL